MTNQKGQRGEAWCRDLELLAGWEVSPPAAGEATWQSGVSGGGLGPLGSLPANRESLEYFNKNNVHLGVFWLKISSPRQGWEERHGWLGTGK